MSTSKIFNLLCLTLFKICVKVGGAYDIFIIFVVKMVEVDICEKPAGIARGGQDECFLNAIFKYSHGEKSKY